MPFTSGSRSAGWNVYSLTVVIDVASLFSACWFSMFGSMAPPPGRCILPFGAKMSLRKAANATRPAMTKNSTK